MVLKMFCARLNCGVECVNQYVISSYEYTQAFKCEWNDISFKMLPHFMF